MALWLPPNVVAPIPPPSTRERPVLLFVLTATMILVTLLNFLGGCSWVSPTVTKTSSPPEAATMPQVSQTTSGSLWNDNGEFARLYSDLRASRVGDIVTIRVTETASGAKTATTKTSKDSALDDSFSGTFTSFFDLPARALAFLSPSASIKVNTKDSYAGNGATTRNDQLTASMTAIVMEVYPNGNLKILGHREVVVNSERQTMELTGIIRPIDVDSKNVVQSTSIADAKISYTGFGVVDDKQHPGWLGRIMNFISPF
jgi:flagellar L-ring protein precursor FlgH